MVNACFLHEIFMDHFLLSMDGEDQLKYFGEKKTETKNMFDV
jgi:hypothetical protein